jgi:hypothetical protein
VAIAESTHLNNLNRSVSDVFVDVKKQNFAASSQNDRVILKRTPISSGLNALELD